MAQFDYCPKVCGARSSMIALRTGSPIELASLLRVIGTRLARSPLREHSTHSGEIVCGRFLGKAGGSELLFFERQLAVRAAISLTAQSMWESDPAASRFACPGYPLFGPLACAVPVQNQRTSTLRAARRHRSLKSIT